MFAAFHNQSPLITMFQTDKKTILKHYETTINTQVCYNHILSLELSIKLSLIKNITFRGAGRSLASDRVMSPNISYNCACNF